MPLTQAHRLTGAWRVLLLGATALLFSLVAHDATAQPRSANAEAAALADAGPAWAALTAAQRRALAPLQGEWAAIDTPRKQKWMEIASRFDRMSSEDRARVQQRMATWVKLSPKQRNEARQNYQGSREISPRERQARWEAYQALPEAQRRGLADRSGGGSMPATAATAADRLQAGESAKINIVPNTLLEARRPRPVAPSVVQARPGATTQPMSQRPTPPLHQQTGLPKVAATPGFVDAATLLPQRGPQGAATEPRRTPAK